MGLPLPLSGVYLLYKDGEGMRCLPVRQDFNDWRNKEKMKRILSMTLAFLMLLSLLAGCGGAPQTNEPQNTPEPASDGGAETPDTPEAQSIQVAARVNVLKDISKMMAEELGREATVEELAEKMKMTAEEIKDIMKVTLDAMSVSPDAGF